MRARVVGDEDGTPDSVTRMPAGLEERTPTPTGMLLPASGVTFSHPARTKTESHRSEKRTSLQPEWSKKMLIPLFRLLIAHSVAHRRRPKSKSFPSLWRPKC